MDEKEKQHSSETSFDFAFGNPTFSDRTLRLIIILDDSAENDGNESESSELVDENTTLSLQQMRKYFTKLDVEEGCQDICIGSKKVKTLHVTSAILAAKSSIFHKMFTSKNTGESENREVALLIHSSEEVSLIDAIKFMYSSNLLSAKLPIPLMKVLLTADRFGVPSCVTYCCKLLQSLPLSLELAFLFIDLPFSVVSSNEAAQQLVEASKSFIFSNLNDISKYHEHIITLSLDGIKTFLSSDDFKVDSEDAAYDLFVEWLKVQYSTDPEQHCQVYNSELCNVIRLQLMTTQKLLTVFTTSSANNNNITRLDTTAATSVIEAIVSGKDDFSLSRRRRAYNSPPVSVMYCKIPFRQCWAHLDLKRREFESLGRLDSQTFSFSGQAFYLTVGRYDGYFGMHLNLKGRERSVLLTGSFSVRTDRYPWGFDELSITEVWRFRKDDKEDAHGHRNLFNQTWDSVMAKDSKYFINDTMHLRAFLHMLLPAH